jgi:hypothetical protein
MLKQKTQKVGKGVETKSVISHLLCIHLAIIKLMVILNWLELAYFDNFADPLQNVCVPLRVRVRHDENRCAKSKGAFLRDLPLFLFILV